MDPLSSAEYIIRETRALFDNPLVLWAGGKDSTTMLYLMRNVFPTGKIPFTIGFIDTGFEFNETYRFLDQLDKAWNLELVKIENRAAKERGMNPTTFPKFQCCVELKTNALNNYIREHNNDAVFVGIRWSECGIRGKEKFYSWRADPPHYRVHPLLNWSEEDIWNYIHKENIPINTLYSQEDHDGQVYRSIGCYPCTSTTKKTGVAERSGRDLDKEDAMEKHRALGYM
jgi:sulfate adenylyltransferase subunit 2